MTTEEQQEEQRWKLAVYEDAVAHPEIRRLAWHIAEQTHTGDAPLSTTDLQAARRYLRTCLLRMTPVEIENLRKCDISDLWARGALGACQYRQGGAGSARRRKGGRRQSKLG